MKRLAPFVVFALLVLLLTACGSSSVDAGPDEEQNPGGSVDIAGNNSAVLDGAVIGSGLSASTDLRKTVEVDLLDPSADFELGNAYLTRTYADSETIYLVLPVTNRSDDALCFVKFRDLAYMDGDLAVVTEELGYANGSVGLLSSGSYTDTCLDAGERGYFLAINLAESNQLYSVVDSVEIGAVSASTQPSDHSSKLMPTSYSVTSDGSQLAVVMENRGTQTVFTPEDNIFSTYILLDNSGNPLGWSFLDSVSSAIAPSSTGVFNDQIHYDGSASKLLVYADFEATALTSAVLSLTQVSTMKPKALLELRNQIEAEKERAISR